MSVGPVISDDLAWFLESGLSLAIGTRDADLAPEGMRAWCIRVEPDRRHVELYVYAPAVTATLANLDVCPLMAVVGDRPHDHKACQLKGFYVGIRPARDDERPLIEEQFRALCLSLDDIGFPQADYTRATQRWPALVMRMRVTDIFAQDPGPGAGERMTQQSQYGRNV